MGRTRTDAVRIALTSGFSREQLADELGVGMVILPFIMGFRRIIHAAVFNFMAGVIPPMPILGRSLL